MPNLYELSTQMADQLLEQVDSDLETIKDFSNSIIARAEFNAALMKDGYGRILIIAGSLNKILKIFGVNINVGSINIELLLDGFVQLKQIKQQKEAAVDQKVAFFGNKLAEARLAMDAKRRTLFSEVFGPIRSIKEQRARMISFKQNTSALRTEVTSMENKLSEVAAFSNIIIALDSDLEDIIKSVMTFGEEILDAISGILEGIAGIMNILKTISFITDIGPFNYLPGTLAVCQGYIGLIMSLLNELSGSIGNLMENATDFSEISLKMKLLFNSKVAHMVLVRSKKLAAAGG